MQPGIDRSLLEFVVLFDIGSIFVQTGFVSIFERAKFSRKFVVLFDDNVSKLQEATF